MMHLRAGRRRWIWDLGFWVSYFGLYGFGFRGSGLEGWVGWGSRVMCIVYRVSCSVIRVASSDYWIFVL